MPDPRRARTRARLLEAGHRVIARDGVSGLRIADITAEAGVAIGSFQNHFASKDELVAAVVREAIQSLAAEIVGAPGPDDPPAEVAMRALRRFVRLAHDDPAFCALIVNLAHGDELFVEAVRPFATDALRRAVDAGVFVIEDVDVAVSLIVGGALAVMRRSLDGLTEPGADSRLARAVLLSMQVEPVEAERLSTLSLGN
ncbi:MAG TPA: TetR/AcrR family transcriptional regulator [Sporichthyaceae bacterium]